MIGFLFLTYDKVFNENIWTEYFKGANENEYKIFVHPKDQILILNQPLFKNCIVPKTCKTKWGDFSLLEAQKILMENACKIPEITHVVLVSQNTLPTTSFRAFHNFLKNRSSVIFYKLPTINQHTSRYHSINNPSFPKEKFLFQSQWCIISRNHAKILLEEHDKIKKIFGNMRIPDEHVYINYLKNYKNKEIENTKILYIEWNNGTPKLFKTLSNDLIKKIKNLGCFFIRKADDNSVIDVKYLLS